ncbi:hypothetical protein GCM10017784_40080 [Deinococcus indicus]|uniref:GGDEF domain-containing protein n=1 Tax=Deinococcus indicus TaxID=223556 RepID=UPI00174B57CD|nr:diguanylate cyclase [Deinococcus indicus]GHG41192.1 hypothetical protein GCM10017784_40080 [Deinococcus indicus]
MTVTLTDAHQAWELRFTSPALVHAWLTSVRDSELAPASVKIIQSFLAWRQGRIAEALDLIGQAEALLGEEPSLWRGRMLSMSAVLVYITGDISRSVETLQEQLALGRLLKDTELQALALNDMGVIAGWTEAAGAHTLYSRALELIGEPEMDGSPAMTAMKGLIAANIAGLYQQKGQYDLAAPLIDLAESLFQRAHSLILWPWCVNIQVAHAMHEGHPEQARLILDQAMDLLGRSPEGMGESLSLLQYTAARLEMEAGQPQESLAWLNRMREGEPLREEAQMRVLDLEASIQAQLGRHEEAYMTTRALLEAIWKRCHQERSVLVSRLELSELTEQAQRQVEEAQQVMGELQEQLKEVQSVGKHYRTLSVTDALTGLGNRRQFDEDLRMLKEGDGLLMIDIDHFKRVNDALGHLLGDRVIRQVAARIEAGLPEGGRTYRYGGEEFAVLLRGDGWGDLFSVAEQVRHAVSRSAGEDLPAVTVSVGGALIGSVVPGSVLEEADRALYEAKRAGRNRTCVADPSGQ